MFGWLATRAHKKKLARSIGRDPLRTGDPADWLGRAASVLELRTTCPHPGWLVHCAYWANVPTQAIGKTAIAVAEHATRLMGGDLPFGLITHTMPELAARVVALEQMYPAIRGIDLALPTQGGRWIHLLDQARAEAGQDAPSGPIDVARLTAAELAAAGMVLTFVGEFHREGFAREALALTAAGAGTMFALALPAAREELMALQRTRYGWPTSMTSTTFTR